AVLRWSVEALLQCEEVAAVVVVVSAAERARAASLLPSDPRIVWADGGAERTDSVRSGLKALEGRGIGRVLMRGAAGPGRSARGGGGGGCGGEGSANSSGRWRELMGAAPRCPWRTR